MTVTRQHSSAYSSDMMGAFRSESSLFPSQAQATNRHQNNRGANRSSQGNGTSGYTRRSTAHFNRQKRQPQKDSAQSSVRQAGYGRTRYIFGDSRSSVDKLNNLSGHRYHRLSDTGAEQTEQMRQPKKPFVLGQCPPNPLKSLMGNILKSCFFKGPEAAFDHAISPANSNESASEESASESSYESSYASSDASSNESDQNKLITMPAHLSNTQPVAFQPARPRCETMMTPELLLESLMNSPRQSMAPRGFDFISPVSSSEKEESVFQISQSYSSDTENSEYTLDGERIELESLLHVGVKA